MPENRNVEVYKQGTQTPVLEKTEAYVVSDAQLAEEQERNAMAKAGNLIDGINDLTGAKTFLKRLCRRLIKNGVLP